MAFINDKIPEGKSGEKFLVPTAKTLEGGDLIHIDIDFRSYLWRCPPRGLDVWTLSINLYVFEQSPPASQPRGSAHSPEGSNRGR